MLSRTGAGDPRTSRAPLVASGSYLAARHASVERDAAAAASITARRCAPIRATANCSIAPSSRCSPNGDIDEAVKLAERVLQVDKTDRIARLVLGVRALKQKQYRGRAPRTHPVGARPDHRSGRHAADGLDAGDAGDAKAAVETIDKLPGRTGTRSSRICMPA